MRRAILADVGCGSRYDGHTECVGSLEIRVEPDVGELRHVRHALDAWLEGKGMTEPPRAAFILATHEALANAIQHSGGTSLATVHATTGQEGIEIVISDDGQWRVPDESNDERGRGLGLIRALVPGAAITSGESGTTVRLSHYRDGLHELAADQLPHE